MSLSPSTTFIVGKTTLLFQAGSLGLPSFSLFQWHPVISKASGFSIWSVLGLLMTVILFLGRIFARFTGVFQVKAVRPYSADVLDFASSPDGARTRVFIAARKRASSLRVPSSLV